MAVSIEAMISQLGYNGFLNPALPVGFWEFEQTLTGDGTAGQNNIRAIFTETGAELNEQLYSIEQILTRRTTATAEAGTMDIQGWGTNRAVGAGVSRGLVMEFPAPAGYVAITSHDQGKVQLPIWLGGQRKAGGQVYVELVTTNTSGVTQKIHMLGYIWHARSVLSPGGPQRPTGSLFGH
jgi:hypothetical protein